MTEARTLLRGGLIRSPLRTSSGALPTAMLVTGSTVAWVGTAEHAPSGYDRVVDLDGAVVLPGFVDAHVHLTQTGLALTGLDLASCQDRAAALTAVAAHSRAHRGVVLGTGWDETRWHDRRPPTAADLDAASNGGLVYLSRVDGHSAAASSALLERAGLRAGDGLVRLEEHHAVRRAARDAITAAQRAKAIRTARAEAARRGIVALHEMAGPDIAGEADFLDVLAIAADEPGPHVVGYWGELGAVDRARELGAHGAGGDLFVDGSLGSHTAWLTDPYADDATTGHAWLTPDDIADHITACTTAGLQAGFHAIGDAAIDAVLEGCAEAARRVGAHAVARSRHRIEHAELMTDVAACARLGLVASVQPAFDARWGGSSAMYVERLAADRAARMNPFADLHRAGVRLAFGSDAPVTPLDPWAAIRAAVRHQTAAQRLGLEIAFAAHTSGGHAAARADGVGELVPGASASYAVWSGVDVDLHTGLPDVDGPEPDCVLTSVGGTVVFDLAGAML